MATPMEYDTLRELYSSVMAALTRLETQQDIDVAQFKEAENNFVQICDALGFFLTPGHSVSF